MNLFLTHYFSREYEIEDILIYYVVLKLCINSNKFNLKGISKHSISCFVLSFSSL